MKQFKSVVFCLLFVGMMVTSAWAKGSPGVAWTVHNLSSSNKVGWYVGNTDEICVVCHTPHGGSLSGPLWNRSLPSGSFAHYNSASLSLSGLSYTENRVVNDESLLCLSCHDGSVALSHLINYPNSLSGSLEFDGGFVDEVLPQGSVPGPRIGGSLADAAGTGDLSDDHPISFSYALVEQLPTYQTGARKGELFPVGDTSTPGTVLGNGVRLFGNDFRVECSSCHDPHVNYDDNIPGNTGAQPEYTPFLIRSNVGSGLCLACHNK